MHKYSDVNSVTTRYLLISVVAGTSNVKQSLLFGFPDRGNKKRRGQMVSGGEDDDRFALNSKVAPGPLSNENGRFLLVISVFSKQYQYYIFVSRNIDKLQLTANRNGGMQIYLLYSYIRLPISRLYNFYAVVCVLFFTRIVLFRNITFV